MQCENCKSPTNKLTEVEAGNLSNGYNNYWLCMECVAEEVGVVRNDGSFCVMTGSVRSSEVK